MASTAVSPHSVLQDAVAVELCPIDPAAAADYLERIQLDPPQEGWRELIDRIRANPEDALVNALNSPLTLTLIRDTYESTDDIRQLLNFCDTTQRHASSVQAAENITGYLLDRVLLSAYAHRPGQPPPRYDYPTAKNAFEKIATRMKQDGDYNLQWWRIPEWVSPVPRIVGVGLAAGLLAGLVAGLITGLRAGPGTGLWVGLLTVLGIGFMFGAATATRPGRPQRIVKPRLRRTLKLNNLVFGLLVGLLVGFSAGLATWSRVGPVIGLVIGPVVGLVVAFLSGLSTELTDPESTNSVSPVTSWRDDRLHTMVLGLVAWLEFAIFIGAATWAIAANDISLRHREALTFGLAAGLVGGLVLGLVIGLAGSNVWRSSLSTVQLAKQWHTPINLIGFLDDARERNVLRTVGPVYQFRHARLQDRLADNNDPAVP
jgi:hypothetical protein